MDCGFNQERLSMYGDGALSQAGIYQVENHLDECDECRHALEDLMIIGMVLHSLPRERAPREIIERILAKADVSIDQSGWEAAKWTVAAMWSVALDGFTIADEKEEMLRGELPGWVARWVLFV